jgi:hypothetical protein
MKQEHCKECKHEDFRKYGSYKTKEGYKNRCICNKCGKTFSEHKITYTKTEKRLLSFLLNFLENDLEEVNKKEFLSKSKEYRPGISDVKIEPCNKKHILDSGPKGTTIDVFGKKPRLVICESNGEITLVKIPKELVDRYDHHFRLHIN